MKEKRQPTRKSGRARQSTPSGALGNPIPTNAVDDMVQSPSKKFSIESPTDKTVSDQKRVISTPEKQNLKSLISEMGFHEKSPEHQTCVKFTRRRKIHN